MNKQRKIWGIILGVLAGMTLVNVILFVCSVFSPVVFGIILAVQVVSIALIIWRLVVLTQKLRKKLIEKAIQDAQPKKKEVDPTEIYKILGIPVQYDDTGRVLTIYELLGLVPVYDENGNRIKTIYEELNINPKFTKDGQELPTIVILKNYASKIAKVKSANKTVFKRKLTPEQKDQLIILKKLREKKEELEKKGDVAQVAKINAVIKENKQKKEKITPAKPKETKAASGKAVGKAKVKATKYTPGNYSGLMKDLFDVVKPTSGATLKGDTIAFGDKTPDNSIIYINNVDQNTNPKKIANYQRVMNNVEEKDELTQ